MALTEERKKYLAEWRKNNRKKVIESQRKYYKAHKEICDQRVKECHKKNSKYYSQKSREWQLANPEKVSEIRKRHYKNNSASEIAKVRRRRGRIKHGEMIMNSGELLEVQGMYDFCRIFKNYQVDHIIPLNGKNVSGLHVLSNLQVLPELYNKSKGNKFNQ